MDERLHGLRHARDEAVDEVAGGPLAGFEGVLVRGHPVAGEEVAALEEGVGDVPVKVH